MTFDRARINQDLQWIADLIGDAQQPGADKNAIYGRVDAAWVRVGREMPAVLAELDAVRAKLRGLRDELAEERCEHRATIAELTAARAGRESAGEQS